MKGLKEIGGKLYVPVEPQPLIVTSGEVLRLEYKDPILRYANNNRLFYFLVGRHDVSEVFLVDLLTGNRFREAPTKPLAFLGEVESFSNFSYGRCRFAVAETDLIGEHFKIVSRSESVQHFFRHENGLIR